MNKFKHAAWEVLFKMQKPMHYGEITEHAIAWGLLQSDGRTPEASMNSQLLTDVNSNGTASPFVKTAPATYALNPKSILKFSPFHKATKAKSGSAVKRPNVKSKMEARSIREKQAAQVALDKAVVDSGFVAKAGEHWVCAELLRRGFNASIMSVDVGMDIIATRQHKLFSLQVKTARLSTQNSYIFDIREVALDREHSGLIFYVFVMLGPHGSIDCAVIPNAKLDELIHVKAIKKIINNKVRLTLKARGETLYLGTREHDVNYYWNNWALIR